MAGRGRRRGRFSRRAAFRSPIVSGSVPGPRSRRTSRPRIRASSRRCRRSVWTADYATKRLLWKPRHPLHVLVLRVHRIPRPVTVRVRDEYHGCRSWVEIDRELPFEGTPVMADEEFARAAGSIGMIAGQPEPVPPEPEQLARRAPLRVRRRAVAARMGL